MNLENSIKDVITKKLEEGIVEKLVAEQLENSIKLALKDLLGSYGSVTKVIEKEIKSVMIPYLENYDYSQYITKLDSVLVDILKSSTLENKKLIGNFKELMTLEEEGKEMKVSDLFDRWIEYVKANVKTDGLEVNYDGDEPAYEYVEVNFEVEYNEERSWSDMQSAVVVFECEHEEELNFKINIHSWKSMDKGKWTIDYTSVHDLNSLKYLSEFEILLMKLKQNHTKLILDSDGDSDEVEPEQKPEADWS